MLLLSNYRLNKILFVFSSKLSLKFFYVSYFLLCFFFHSVERERQSNYEFVVDFLELAEN